MSNEAKDSLNFFRGDGCRAATLLLHGVVPVLATTLQLLVGIAFVLGESALIAQGYPPTIRSEGETRYPIGGVVSSQDGDPIAGATVYLTQRNNDSGVDRYRGAETARSRMPKVSTDRNGKYQIEAQLDRRLLVIAPGYAPKSLPLPTGNLLDVQLDEGYELVGRILLSDGSPVSGAEIMPRNYAVRLAQSEIEKLDDEAREQKARLLWRDVFPKSGKTFATKTNHEGYFRIQHMPHDTWFDLSVDYQEYPFTLIQTGAFEIFGPYQRDTGIPQKFYANDFEMTLSREKVYRLSGVDERDGKEAAIRSLCLSYDPEDWSLDRELVAKFGKPEVLFSKAAETLRYQFLTTYPANNALLGYAAPVLNYKFREEDGVLSRKVEFRSGIPVSGVIVDKLTGKPIPNVQLMWRTIDKLHRITPDGDCFQTNIFTDRNGEFSCSVPNVAGRLGPTGKVPGYRSIWNWSRRQWIEQETPGLLDRFTHRIIPSELSESDKLEVRFELMPSFTINVEAIKTKSDIAVPDAVVNASQATAEELARLEMEYSPQVTKIADANGKVVFPGFLSNMFQLELARKRNADLEASAKNENEKVGERWGGDVGRSRWAGYPCELTVFSTEGFWHGKQDVPLPQIDDAPEINVQVRLHESATLEGRFVDLRGQGVSDLEVTVKTKFERVKQQWKTKTRSDGRFRVVGLPVNAALYWEWDTSRVQSKTGFVFPSPVPGLEHGAITKIGEVQVYNMSFLMADYKLPNLKGLSKESALRAIAAWRDTCVRLLPERMPLGYQGNSELVSSEPERLFRKRVSQDLSEMLASLAKKHPGGDFELMLLKKAFAMNMGLAPRNSAQSPMVRWVFKRLEKSQKYNPEAFLFVRDIGRQLYDGAYLEDVWAPYLGSKEPQVETGAALELTLTEIQRSLRGNRKIPSIRMLNEYLVTAYKHDDTGRVAELREEYERKFKIEFRSFREKVNEHDVVNMLESIVKKYPAIRGD